MTAVVLLTIGGVALVVGLAAWSIVSAARDNNG